MGTYSAKPARSREWVMIDAEGLRRRRSLDRGLAAARQAQADLHAARHCGDNVIVINAAIGGADRPQVEQKSIKAHRYMAASRSATQRRSRPAASPSALSRSDLTHAAARPAGPPARNLRVYPVPSIRTPLSSRKKSNIAAMNRRTRGALMAIHSRRWKIVGA